MQPNIMKAGLCSTVSAAVVVSLTGLVPVQANATPEPAVSDQLAGKTIFLDPGHQGSAHSENLSRQVDNGRGGTKDCQTTGMTSLNGVPEHTINWQVAQLVQASLEALGADVVLSRADDTGWGGCVDDRARAANASGAEVAVSIHADSAPADQRGFHLIVPALPIPNPAADQAQSGPGRAVSTVVRDAYLASGFPAATYAGVDNGLQTRDDIAGPALTQVPMVFVEMGNGANPEDAALLESREGQLKHAVAIATGVVGYLLDKPVTATPAAFSPAPGRVPVSTTAEPSATTTPSKPAAAVDPDGAAAPADSTGPSASGTTTKSVPAEDESSGTPTTKSAPADDESAGTPTTTASAPADAADPNAPSDTVTTTRSAPAPADSGSASDRPAAYFPARVPVSTGVPTTTPSEAADPSATVTTTKSAPAPADSGSAADRPEAAAPALVPTSTPSKPADAAEPTGTATPTPANSASGTTTKSAPADDAEPSGAPTTTTAPAAAGQAGSTPGADSTEAEPTDSEANSTPLPEEPAQDGSASTTTPAPTSTRAPAEEPASDAGQPQSTSTVPTTTAAAPARPVSAAPKPPAGSSGHFQVPGGNEGRPPSGSGGQLAVPPSPEPARAGTGTHVRTAAPGEPAAPAAPSPRKRETTPKPQATPDEELPDLSSLGGPILKVMDMLMPLAQSLGMDNTMITNQLINLAYTLVGMVFGPTK
ncbi:N-acetylmuramoyl-L-alanine amidase [Nocardia neocaledoniensis]|uniref:N-acetylmuramoyl-L-alanine amidase n=2 Tax=Nocardia neocaledoniensis TaxID=236511 RepID=A0A317NUU2_9NOCA|nr:N-acetylmuramoyl-L-alanine amidase [Nocardia neocaledoniensis]